MSRSTCATIDCGSTLRSKLDTAPRVPAGPARRPLSRTSVRSAPRPRSEMVCAPVPPLVTKLVEIAEVICEEPAAIGEPWTMSLVLIRPWRTAICGSTTVSGAGAVNSSRRMREPVTKMVVPLLPSALTGCVSSSSASVIMTSSASGSSCASTGLAANATERATGAAAPRSAVRSFTDQSPLCDRLPGLRQFLRVAIVPGRPRRGS